MRYRVLGPLEAETDNGPVTLGGQKERLLLALLLTRPNQVVPVEALVEGLWGEQPPSTAAKTLQSHVVRLRRALEPARARGAAGVVLVTREPGYLLRVAPGTLDATRFEEQAAAGRRALGDGSAERAGALLREALGLWRGRAFEEFLDTDVGAAESDRLGELRLVALEDRIEADLRLGRHRELVAELEGLVREQPLRERLWAQLLLALYRSGRQADALLAYQRARSILVEELGIDPGTELRRLHAAILAQDTALDLRETVQASRAAAAAAEPMTSQTAGSRSHLRLVRTEPADEMADRRKPGGNRPAVPAGLRRSRWRLAVAGLVVVLLVPAALVANRIADRDESVAAIASNSLGLIGLKAGTLVGQVPLEARSGQVAAGEGAVWVANAEQGTVSRVDAATRRVVQRITVGRDPAGVAVGDGAVWVANSGERSVSWINPATTTEVKRVPVGNGPTGIALGDGAVWVANSLDNSVSRIDPNRGVVVATIPVGGTPSGVAVGLGAVWVSNAGDGTVSRISPSSNTVVRPITVGNGPRAIAVGAGAVWVANSLDGTVFRIDPARDVVVDTVEVGDGPNAVAVSPGAVWAASELRGTVSRIDPDTTNVVRTIHVGSAPAGAAVTKDGLWVSTSGAPSSHRGGVLKLTSAKSLNPSIDPALAEEDLQSQLLHLTNDGLVGYKQVGGADGSTLVADLATSKPRPTDGGTTYTFQLRPGIRYSTGQVVTPEDVRSSVERGFKMRSTYAQGSFWGVVGADACNRRPATCRLSRGIVTDPSANTVTFHLTEPDPDFLFGLAEPAAFVVPAGTPARDVGTTPIPATGPYMIQEFVPKQRLTLVRNPQFREWSRAAQPDGYPDRIEWSLADGGWPKRRDTAVDAVERGHADWYGDQPSSGRIDELTTRYAGQTHLYPYRGSFQMYLNTRLPPFDDLRVRRAVAYAVDRGAVRKLYPGPAEVSCQLLWPNFPGYQPYCPYTLDPGAAGTWTAPDRATAERLIKESGTSGMKVTVWSFPLFAGVSRYFVRLLDSLGYDARLRTVGDDTSQASFDKFSFYLNDSRNKAQMGAYWWQGAWSPAGATSFLRCDAFEPDSIDNVNTSEFCDRELDGRIDHALSLQTTDPAKTGAAWAAVDRQIVDQAPAIGLLVPQGVDLLSKRVDNYQHNPVVGVLLSQLWVV